MLSPFWHRLAPGIVLNDFSLGACIVTVFVGFAAEPAKGTFNVENTLAESIGTLLDNVPSLKSNLSDAL
jgi:hypothetical protein